MVCHPQKEPRAGCSPRPTPPPAATKERSLALEDVESSEASESSASASSALVSELTR